MLRSEVLHHFESVWKSTAEIKQWTLGPTHELPEDFCVLQFPPTAKRRAWTYASCGMSQPGDDSPLELYLLSPKQEDLHVELLTVVAHYHGTANSLGVGHIVNFGRPWLPGSDCEHGLVSLPYLDGPALEWYRSGNKDRDARCLWLIPITLGEREHAKKHGLESLEQLFESARFNYLDPRRASVVPPDIPQ